VNALICEAIRGRLLLGFGYQGFLRVVQPYCHGRGSEGQELLRAVQVRGGSRSGGNIDSGKLWTVAKIVGLRVLEESFAPDDPKYNPNDKAIVSICCRV
jgi:hypothetical protein